MDSVKTPHTGAVFSGNEILELCDSLKDVHRVLKALGQFLGDLDDHTDNDTNAVRLDFQRWGLRQLSENFLRDQYLKLNRITEIYREETDSLFQKTKP